MIKRNPEKMHSIKNDKPDWYGLSDYEMNAWQKVARDTRGLVTVPNLLTLIGTGLSINGIYDYTNGNRVKGMIKVATGRMLDMADGKVAHAQKVKGPVGKRLDASADMLQLAYGLYKLKATETIPNLLLFAVAIPKVVGTTGTLFAEARGNEINVTEEGKIGTAGLWFGIGSFMLSKSIEGKAPDSITNSFRAIGYLGMLAGGALAIKASADYLKSGLQSQQSNQ